MKKSPKKFDQKISFFAKNLPGIYFIVIGACLSLLLFTVSFNDFLRFLPQFRVATQFQAEPVSASGKPLNLFLANITGQQASLVWVSEARGRASAYLGDQRFTDNRGENTVDNVHQVTIGGLQPGMDFSLMICGDLSCQPGDGNWYGLDTAAGEQINFSHVKSEQIVLNGLPIKVRTGRDLNISGQPSKLAFGRVTGLNQTAILVLTLKNQSSVLISQPLITLVDLGTNWAIDLANARTEDGQKFFEISGETSIDFNLVLSGGHEFLRSYLYQEVENKPLNLEVQL